jgi:hypothetical protein
MKPSISVRLANGSNSFNGAAVNSSDRPLCHDSAAVVEIAPGVCRPFPFELSLDPRLFGIGATSSVLVLVLVVILVILNDLSFPFYR